MSKKLKYVPKYDLSHIVNAKNSRIKPPFTWYTLISTWFMVGRIPFAPGTLGSLAVYPVFYFIVEHSSGRSHVMEQFWLLLVTFFVLGWASISKYEKVTRTHDHRSVVIDEVLGMFLIFAMGFDTCLDIGIFLRDYIDLPTNFLAFLVAFVTFRYFDIRKPFFIGYIDRLMKSSVSVILDDLLAALFSYFTIVIINTILQYVA